MNLKALLILLTSIYVVCILILGTTCFYLLNQFIILGYDAGSLVPTQQEAATLSTLIPANLSPKSLEDLAVAKKIPFRKSCWANLTSHPPPFESAYDYGNLTLYFDAQSNLIDVRGHLLDVSLMNRAIEPPTR